MSSFGKSHSAVGKTTNDFPDRRVHVADRVRRMPDDGHGRGQPLRHRGVAGAGGDARDVRRRAGRGVDGAEYARREPEVRERKIGRSEKIRGEADRDRPISLIMGQWVGFTSHGVKAVYDSLMTVGP